MAEAFCRARPRLTVGMACFDDFNGVYFSVQALQLYHADVLDQLEILVVDNHPDGDDGQAVRNLMTNWVPQGRYIAAPHVVGTAAPRNLVFAEARGDAVLCLDCHVLLEAGVLSRLLEYYAAHPNCRDLLHGPLLNDRCQPYATHMDPIWRDEMFGVWGSDPRGLDPAGPAFEIPMHGCGLMSCRKDAWLGFHPQFRGFGGEEGYIHEKYRQAGQRVLCLPWLRWLHRFGRPAGISYPLTLNDRVRNYVLGRLELHQSYDDVLEHFAPLMSHAAIDSVLAELQLPSILDHWFPHRKQDPPGSPKPPKRAARPRSRTAHRNSHEFCDAGVIHPS
jgi:glycosyltransferase involved in cell wall biosynthesis